MSSAPMIPWSRLRPILEPWVRRAGCESSDYGIRDLAKASGVPVRRVRQFVRSDDDGTFTLWQADSMLVCAGAVWAWLDELHDLYSAWCGEDEREAEAQLALEDVAA